MKVLIIKRDKIGDMLLTTPVLRLLREAQPDATIHVLANDYNAWVLDGNSDVDEVIVYPRVRHGGRIRPVALLDHWSVSRRLRRERYDFAVVANGGASPRALRRATACRPGRVVAYVDEPHGRQHPSLLVGQSDAVHETARIRALFEPLGVSVDTPLPAPWMAFPESKTQSARRWLNTWSDAGRCEFILIGLGARRRNKQPDAKQVQRWARLIHEQFGLHSVLVWTPGGRNDPLYPGDDELVQPLLDDPLPILHPYSGDLSTVVGLIGLARASIFPDSGLMHVASASPGGVIGLFADIGNSADPGRWGPLGARAEVLVADRMVAEIDDETILSALGHRLLMPVAHHISKDSA